MLRFASYLTAALLFVGSTACTVQAQGRVRTRGAVVVEPAPTVVVMEEPPPPRYVHVQPRRGYVFIQGRWDRRGNNWHWVDGHWERTRANAYYQPGRWERNRNRGHVYIEGRWVVRNGRR